MLSPPEPEPCAPERAPEPRAPEPSPEPPSPAGAEHPPPGTPAGLGARGRLLWTELTRAGDLSPGHLVLAAEACRCADRLERLDGILRDGQDRAWLEVITIPAGLEDASVTFDLVVDKLLSEARMQQLALRQMVAELRTSRALPAGSGTGGDPVDDELERRRAERAAQGR
jgi:hypothetical protein